MILLPRFYFEDNYSETLIKKFFNYLEINPVQNKQVQSPKLTKLVIEIIKTITNYFQSLEFDISERIASKENIHYLKEADFDELAESLKYESVVNGFFSSTYFRVFIRYSEKIIRKENMPRILRTICHELIHSIGYTKIALAEETEKFNILAMGLDKNLSDNYLNESIVDLTTSQIIKYYWRDHPLLKTYARESFNKVAYLRGIMLLDALIEKVSDTHNLPYHKVLTMLQIDFMTGTDRALQLLKKTIGIKNYTEYEKITYIENPEKLKEIAVSFNLDSFVKEISTSDKYHKYIYCKRL